MGLFKKEYCAICGSETSAMARTKLINGQYVCIVCQTRAGMSDESSKMIMSTMPVEDIKARIALMEQSKQESKNRCAAFQCTYRVGNYIWFDDANQWFLIPKANAFGEPNLEGCHVYSYSELTDYEIVEDGSTIAKGGLGKAVVGGALFGVAGAIAGGTSKKTKNICNRLYVSIMTSNSEFPVANINLITGETATSSPAYNNLMENAHAIIAKLKTIINQLERDRDIPTVTSAVSPADEIKKYKELLDMGALTEEEFEAKKKQLLGL